MTGTILENLSNRKLSVVLATIALIQIVSFLIGAFVGKNFCPHLIKILFNSFFLNLLFKLLEAPSPSNTDQIIGTMCLPTDYNQLSIPRHSIQNGQIIPKNCRRLTAVDNM